MFLPIFKPIIISCTALLWSFVTFRFKVCVWLGWAKQPRRFHAVHNAPVHNTQNIPRLSGWGTKRCMTFRFDFFTTIYYFTKQPDLIGRVVIPPQDLFCVSTGAFQFLDCGKSLKFLYWSKSMNCGPVVSPYGGCECCGECINALQEGMLRKGLNTCKPLTVRCSMLGLRHAAFETLSQFRIHPEAEQDSFVFAFLLSCWRMLKVLFPLSTPT